MPYTPENWATRTTVDVPLMEKIEKGIRDSLAHLGVVALDSFPGATDVAKWEAALAHLGAQTYKPTLVLSNRFYDLRDAAPETMPTGFRMSGPLGSQAREFRNTCKVKCPAGGLFAVAGGNKDFSLAGVSFEGTSNGAFLGPSPQNGSGGAWWDLSITDCSFSLFGPTFIQGAVTRANWQRWYVNSGTDTKIAIGGTDSSLFTDGHSFMSSAQNSTNQPLIDTGALSNTNLGKMYLTPQGGYGLRVINARMGLTFSDFTMTSWGRTGTKETQRAGVIIEGGTGCVFNNLVLFGVNAAALDPGDITVTGGADHVFNGCVFVKTYEGYTAPNLASGEQVPAIHTTVPIRVTNPIAVGGRPKVLGQATAGLITCNDPSWTIVTDPS